MTILSEFDLDLPYKENEWAIRQIMIDNKCDYDSAIKFHYENYWKQKRNTFRLETRCITALYERFLGKFITNGCWKVLIECVESISNSHHRDLLGVFTIEILFNIDDYFNASDSDKKRIALEALKIGVDKIILELGWERERFDEAYYKIIENNFDNQWIWKRPIKSPDKRYIAEVFCRHGMYSFDISIIIKTHNGEKYKCERIITEKPDEFYFMEYLGRLKWISSNEVELKSKGGEKSWIVKI